MKNKYKKIGWIGLSLIFLLNGGVSAAPKEYGDIKDVDYVRNYDGDTITVNIFKFHPVIGDKISIRINGIDTPEIRGKCKEEKILALRAKEMVKTALTSAKKINLLNIKRGKYFRIVADVELEVRYGTVKLNDLLIKSNLAVPYDGGTKTKNWCE
jgi:micrococcal nuclease